MSPAEKDSGSSGAWLWAATDNRSESRRCQEHNYSLLSLNRVTDTVSGLGTGLPGVTSGMCAARLYGM